MDREDHAGANLTLQGKVDEAPDQPGSRLGKHHDRWADAPLVIPQT
jgi:hypothetical protein